MGIGRDLTALPARRHFVKLAHGDAVEPVIGSACNGCCAGILLCSVNAIGEPIVGRHMIELGSRLVVPAAPGPAAVDGDQSSLVDPENAPIRILGVDPERVEIIPRWIALY